MRRSPSRSESSESPIVHRVAVVRVVVATDGALVCWLGDQEGCLVI